MVLRTLNIGKAADHSQYLPQLVDQLIVFPIAVVSFLFPAFQV